MARHSKEFDAVIIGAGIAGTTLAGVLARQGFTVALVDRDLPPPYPDSYALRVSAISPGSTRVLDFAGAWPLVAARRVSAYRRMVVWDAGSTGSISFDAQDVAAACLGHIVENDLIVAALHSVVAHQDNVRCHLGAEITALHTSEDFAAVQLADGQRLRGHLLVGADGAQSWVRRELGIGDHTLDYEQRAIVAQVRTELPHAETAWQRFLGTGPLAFLPLADGDCSIVWSCDRPLDKELLQLSDTDFAHRLTGAFEGRLGEVLSTGPRAAFPLSRIHADGYVALRSVLIGDAAHRVHPLAGQGANLGIMDAATLAQVIGEARSAGGDIGSARVLRRYERWRKSETVLMMRVLDGLRQLFGSTSAAAQRLRGIGLDATDRFTAAKNLITRRAMGIAGDVPRLVAHPGR